MATVMQPRESETDLETRNLSDVFDFACEEQLPDVSWLRRLNLERPRQDLRCLPMSTRRLKRIGDLIIASLLLILLAPVMLVVAVLVRLTSPGPIIFRQTRVGLNLRRPGSDRRQQRNGVPEGQTERRQPGRDRRREFLYGRHFVLYKFRTMRNDAEKDGARFAVEGDARVTIIGGVLRKTRLDELPQLWNVLRGDMTLVGPRPERPEFIEELSDEIPNYLNRLGLKPGLTGVAQVVNGYDNDLAGFRRKVAFDLLYLQNCCLWNDFMILLRTIGVVLTGRGAI
ncbi:UDP-N-acetylgalactosamine-undecaprenyl-phosphate N-acetylgalactosaminephosphotransferase [Maioricimonas rarisocia]|uniref:UDP-N-acetylgalactosamine-undecaprenyl-phosphate N-acetylgalactosaminephosphotransferase n=1 Tax=Maioricimonas rarisocia TaxID=2528026 RepID=A0A517Z440_9PLAN|nr:sugar transferase [Maioricimonas rarisocia]QDU37244.1 UDP-N-acetylgalactosamine-undecaprenyl-phosphate N-acetylgalactosaminephosphotransferase [Maioricimonas rarisocia]